MHAAKNGRGRCNEVVLRPGPIELQRGLTGVNLKGGVVVPGNHFLIQKYGADIALAPSSQVTEYMLLLQSRPTGEKRALWCEAKM